MEMVTTDNMGAQINKADIFSRLANEFNIKADDLLVDIDDYSPEPIKNIVEACEMCLKSLDNNISLIEDEHVFIVNLRKMACIAIAGYKSLTGVGNIASEMTDLYRRKNADYGNSFDESLNKYGVIASVVRISDKVNRLVSLVCRNNQAQVNTESISDTFIDLANYSIMTLVWIESKSMNNE